MLAIHNAAASQGVRGKFCFAEIIGERHHWLLCQTIEMSHVLFNNESCLSNYDDHTLLQHATATHYCNRLLQHTTATRSCPIR
mmetsp:Transcript_63006/g.101922  ORF Transcript_63006/g.101922 Transcript_63006/m.101922 type:complete len:83 (+) Transcript_63006:776-1024(+)